MGVDWDLAPKEQGYTLCGAAILKDTFGYLNARPVLRKEEHGDAIVALIGEQMAFLLGFLAKETMGHLEQNTRTIARVALKALAATMLKVYKDR